MNELTYPPRTILENNPEMKIGLVMVILFIVVSVIQLFLGLFYKSLALFIGSMIWSVAGIFLVCFLLTEVEE